MTALPTSISESLGQPQYPRTASFPAELSYSFNTLSATENGNPLYWDAAVADEITRGPTLPPSTLSLWMRPHRWEPGASEEQFALQIHFDLKATLDLPEAIMSENALILHEPVRPGDIISHHQVLRSISDSKTTKLGVGRFWVIDVEYHNQAGTLIGIESYTGFGYSRPTTEAGSDPSPPPAPVESDPASRLGEPLLPLAYNVTATTVVLGALASRDWRPMHHDYKFATIRNGTRDIFLNAPNLASWLERYITDWTGPRGRIGRLKFRMHDSIYPGDQMLFHGTVTDRSTDDRGCDWADIDIAVTVGGRLCTTCVAHVAVATSSLDNPWSLRGDDWKP